MEHKCAFPCVPESLVTDHFTSQAADRRPKRSKLSQEEKWVAEEDVFVLRQAHRRALIRVREGRGKASDWLCVSLRYVNQSSNPFEDEQGESDLDVVDPQAVLEGLDQIQLGELAKDIESHLTLEKEKQIKDFWNTMLVVCRDRQGKAAGSERRGRGLASVSNDVEKLFSTKSFKELQILEKQIRDKLRSDEPIDVEYWEHLLSNLISWQSRAKMRKVSRMAIDSQVQGLRKAQAEDANRARDRVHMLAPGHSSIKEGATLEQHVEVEEPQPALRVQENEKAYAVWDERSLLDDVTSKQRELLKLGYASKPTKVDQNATSFPFKSSKAKPSIVAPSRGDEPSLATKLLFEREIARGVGENEEVFANEEELATAASHTSGVVSTLRKPRYFNRVLTGYDWNKYNQTHYDHDNPPPKVVQGYNFNVLYPDLLDKTSAPTYNIIREHGRRRGQSFAMPGDEDTCLIRFSAGPPYQDIAFRIVDKEWDYSSKTRRFVSTFEKGVLKLSFQFKRIFYRK